MPWLEQRIRRYEHRRWTTDNNRRVFPFAWGLEHIGGPAPAGRDRTEDLDPRSFLKHWASQTIQNSRQWFDVEPARDYRLQVDRSAVTHEVDRSAVTREVDGSAVTREVDGSAVTAKDERVLTFTSSVQSPWPENNTVYAQFFPARRTGPAVLILPNWNAKWRGQRSLCKWLQLLGISVLRLSLPYHDRRMAKGHERADQLVGPNIGLTLQANLQAVKDARQCLRWLEQQGYTRLGILGTSIGSSVGYITLVHDPAVHAGGFFHVSTYFADVVEAGMTTRHVWEGLRNDVHVDELRQFWAPISPMPYVERGMGAGKNCFLVYGKYDPTFLPKFTGGMLRALRAHGCEPRTLELHCGHYSLELPPFGYVAGYRMGMFFLESLA